MTIDSFAYRAGTRDLGTVDPDQLYAGESDIVTDNRLVLTGQNLLQYTVVALNAAYKLVPWAPAASDGTQNAVGILAVAINTTSPAGDARCPLFIGGVFNHERLVWPVAADTLAERQAAFDRTNISIQKFGG